MNLPSKMNVLLVDDDDQRRQSVSTIFNFLGVAHQMMTFVEWFQKNQVSPDLNVAFIGRCLLPVSLEKLIASFRSKGTQTSLCLLERWDDVEQLTERSKVQLLRVLDGPLTEHVLTDLLHEAQVLKGEDDEELDQSLFPQLIGQSHSMKGLKQSMMRVVDRDVNVMITGESGTGKELIARSLHDYSKRKKGPFVPVNCGAIAAELLESELFGHEKGAYTGAISARAGRFEMADGGTLFLDEIGDMPLAMQVKLLRVLQERCFERVGGSKTIDVDVRIIAATHKNLEDMIITGDFREDLYYRLNVYPIETPPLRERKDDVVMLLHTLSKRAEKQGLGRLRFHSSALESLQRHPWPGNVRELSNLIERLAIMHPDGVVGVSELPAKCRHVAEPEPTRYQAQNSLALAGKEKHDSFVTTDKPALLDESPVFAVSAPLLHVPSDGLDLKQYMESIEKSLITDALDKTGFVVARAAALLMIRRTTLVEKMRKFGIQRVSDK
ncbi:sigma-54 dependent transcriptional regulator [Neptunomonas sp.]|uniref:sigma-54 dependent transcriptional regulator n=1 Tax=Neptunomonas sp. TaxID=1971898 RepID=UPI0025DD458F|nr:sigma-54 dependent transcriptional regulator [Neptunomonas sp.]